ncbi:MAG: amino acid adenylation domain-containing protein [Dokdonella sp.]
MIGIEPDRMIGHSIGEYVAACLAGVFSLRDAMTLVVARAAAMQAQPEGAMLAVRSAVDFLQDQLPKGVEIAAINAPELTVLAGPATAIKRFAEKLESTDIANSALRVSHAFHSASMEAAIEPFSRAFDGVTLNAPTQPFYSCVSGTLIADDEATSPDYWCRQLRQPVRFLDAVRDAAKDNAMFIEVGPGQALTGLIRRTDELRHRAIPSLGQAGQRSDDAWHLINAVGELACRGVMADSARFYAGQQRRLLPLPTYPFHGERYWIDAPAHTAPDMAAGSVMSIPTPLPISPAPVATANPIHAPPRRARLAAELTELFENLSGETIGVEGRATVFLEIGLDSLALTQAALELERRYGLKLKFRRLMEDLDNVDALSELLDRELPADVAAIPQLASTSVIPSPNAMPVSNPNVVAALIQNQLALLQQQTALLSNLAGIQQPTASAPMHAPIATTSTEIIERADLRAQPFGASARISTDRKSMATPEQRQWIDRFIASYNNQTSRSKAFSQSQRKRMADPRVVTGFNPLWKELVYPIVVERSHGARLWDIDGNEYIDLLNSFGANFLGYQPDYIVRALKDQLDRGMEIGPQHPLTAEVADLISDMTGMARVAFCNTGSEAVMGAMRVARTVTGRDTIVIFANSYHGIFDEVIVRGTKQLRSIAAAPGILASAVENVLVLDYGSDEALTVIRERGHELAAVMIEPVQSKNPTLQPVEFVKSLRRLCDAAGCALIFDEVITGFRVAQGGAQEYYGVRADIATYGKVIGGGLPLAVIAGSAQWLDALDGGDWQFGDDSYPEAGVTYFAGTFVRHPLALAAARAALLHLKHEGPPLQRGITMRTEGLVARLNQRFRQLRAPMKAVGFSSLWRILVDDDQPFAGLFWYALRQRGLHVYEQFNGFLTEAHGELEVDEIFNRVSDAARTLLDAKILSRVGGAVVDAIQHKPAVATMPVEAVSERFPLGDAQRDKWLACQYSDESNAAFNESMLLHLDGRLDVAAVTVGLDAIVARHEAFRLCIAGDGSGQWLDRNASLQLQQIDLSGSDVDRRLAAHCRTQMAIPFDLEHAPLARAHLIRLDTDRHALLFIGHHLIFDGWSEAVLLDELQHGYNAAVAGTKPDFKHAESYRAYLDTERQRRSGEQGLAATDYWKQQFANPPAPLQLPLDRPRGRHPDYAAATITHDLRTALLSALRTQARKRGVTLYSVLVHTYARLLAELSGQDDIVVGVPFAGQALAGSGSLFGDGADMLPLRLNPDMDGTVEAALDETHRRLLDAADHQDVSIQNLIRDGALAKPGSPLTRVVFNLNPRLPLLHFTGLTTSLRDCPKTSLFWDMFVNLSEVGDGLSMDLHYASALFDATTVESFVRRYEALLGEVGGIAQTPAQRKPDVAASPRDEEALRVSTVVSIDESSETESEPALSFDTSEESPALAIDSINGDEGNDILEEILAASRAPMSLADADEKEQRTKATPTPAASLMPVTLTPLLQGSEAAIDPGANLPALVAAQAQATPLRIAVEAGERRLTYAGMVQRIDALAAHLVERGVSRGELVGVCLPRGVELPIATLGVQRAGAAYVALDPSYPEERLLDIAGQSALRRIVTLARDDVPPAVASGRDLVVLDELDLREPITTDLPLLDGNDLAYVLFTSGSTGHPKGVRIRQRNLVNFLTSMRREPGIQEDDALVAVTTLSFDISGLEIYLPLLCGARIVIADDNEITEPMALAALIRECDVSILQTTPTLLRMLLDGAGDNAVAGLKLLVGGEALPRGVADRALVHASELWNMYGPTETTIWSTLQRIHADSTDISVGQPIANTDIYLLDAGGHPVAEGERGEIVIAGAGVADGYLNREDLTADRFIADPRRGTDARRYRTGDVGSIRDGRLYCHGRSDHQVKIRGHRIELGDIEATALQLPGLGEAVAAIHEHAPGDQRLLLYIGARASADDPTESLREHLRERLPGYMLPQQIIVLDELPRTPNGKLDRNALPPPPTAKFSTEPTTPSRTDPAAPTRDARTAWLAALWCEMIGLDAVADDDNFFEIGGHSLLAVEMATQVQKDTKVRMNLLMIATGTLGSLAAKLPSMEDSVPRQTAVGKMLGLFGIGTK